MLIFLCCLTVGLFFRFANYSSRWTLSQDQARDAIIARYAISSGQIPVLGPHSSAGDFSFGPLYYWLVIGFTYLSQTIINGGWIGFTILSGLTVVVFTWIGYKFGGKMSAFIFGITAALSASQVLHAPDMLNPIPIPFFISLSFLCLIYFFSTKKMYFALFTGLFIGLAAQLHFQSLLVLPLFYIVSVLFYKRIPVETIESAMEKGVKSGGIKGFAKSFIRLWKVSLGPRIKKRLLVIGFLATGFFIGISPLFYFDLAYGNKLISNFLQFYINGQKNMAVYISWFDDLFQFWPKFIGEVLFDLPLSGYAVILIFILAAVIAHVKRKGRSIFILALVISFFIQILLLHFYKGPRTQIYLMLFQPFILILAAWSIDVFYKFNKYLGAAILLGFIILAVRQDFKILQLGSSVSLMQRNTEYINRISPGKVTLYEGNASSMISYPVYFLLDFDKKLLSDGYKIGLCEDKDIIGATGENLGRNCPKDPSPFQSDGHYLLYDLNGLSAERIEELGFTVISPRKVFESIYEGYIK